MKVLKVLGATCLLAALLTPASAYANFACSGTIAYFGSGAEGAVQVDVGKGVWTICSLSATYNGVTTAQGCQGWYALLVSAKLSGRGVDVYFNPDNVGNDGLTTCEQLGNWTARTPYHISLR